MFKNNTHKIYKNIVAFLGLAIFFSLTSCEEDLTKVNQNKNKNFPSRITYNANITRMDSGMVKVRFKAPLLEEYEFIDTPYAEARKGLISRIL
jgi:Pyruvate/2-oxoacid:ferredoxin oxidoreductase gamma subunit